MFDTPLNIFLFCLFVVIGIVILSFACFLIISRILYYMLLTRTSKEKWGRHVSEMTPDQVAMYDEGLAWQREHDQFKKELHIVNENHNLYAEYYDFGFDRAIIFVPGRTEGLGYGYFFAKPYRECGFNVLTIDQRAHGLSDGKYPALGFDEHRDLIKWAELLHNDFNVKSIVFHGICIGSSCALQALVSENAPSYLDGLIAEGMYPNFYESFKNHMIELKQPISPVLQMVNMWFKHYTGHSMRRGNIDFIDKLEKPILMIHSKEDAYSLPERANDLYNKISHNKKKIFWYEHGAHSKLRFLDSQAYDNAIKEFLTTYATVGSNQQGFRR